MKAEGGGRGLRKGYWGWKVRVWTTLTAEKENKTAFACAQVLDL